MIVSARKLPVFFEEKSDFLRQLRLSEPTFKLKCLITSWVPSSGFILDLRLLFVREFCCARYVGLQAEGNSLPFLITSVTRKLPVLFEVKSDCLRQLRLSEPTFKLKCLTTSWGAIKWVYFRLEIAICKGILLCPVCWVTSVFEFRVLYLD